QRSANGAFWIVPVSGRRAEDRHHGVADKLLHDPAEGLQLVAHRPVVRRQDRAHVLRVELFRARREPNEVDEDDADDPALLARRRFLAERSPAREAEARDLGVVLATGGADGHVAHPRSVPVLQQRERPRRRGASLSTSYFFFPLLTLRLTLAPAARCLPAFGFWGITRPFFTCLQKCRLIV